MTYFFAYGERMDPEKMLSDVPSATWVGPARLEGYRLEFNITSRSWGGGAVNAVPAPNAHLRGVLWKVDADAFRAIDSFRGDEVQARQVLDVVVAGPEGEELAWTYAVQSHEIVRSA